MHACYEVHIEQGPILEAEGVDTGIVHAAMGQRWYTLTIDGFAQLAVAVEQVGFQPAADGRATIGMVQAISKSRNVVPGKVMCSVEFRHPQTAALDSIERELYQAVELLAPRQLTVDVERIFDYAPIAFNPECIARSQQAAEALGYAWRPMVSGAGHDTCYLNAIAPASMIFIPCEKG